VKHDKSVLKTLSTNTCTELAQDDNVACLCEVFYLIIYPGYYKSLKDIK